MQEGQKREERLRETKAIARAPTTPPATPPATVVKPSDAVDIKPLTLTPVK